MRVHLAVEEPWVPFEGPELWLKIFLLFLERPHSSQGFPVSIWGHPISGENLFFLFLRQQHPNGCLGARTGESCPHQTAKLFRIKSQQEL